MMNPVKGFVIFVFIIVLAGCKEDTFDPVQGFEDKLIVFGVLNNKSETQFIKIQKNFGVVGESDINKIQKNLKVEVMERNSIKYVFRDTTIPGISNYSIFYNKDIKLKYNVNYSIKVYDENNNILCDANMVDPPGQHAIGFLDDTVKIWLSPGRYETYFHVYEYHVYVEYQQKINNEWVVRRCEVPIEIKTSENNKDTLFVYPQKENVFTNSERWVKVLGSNFTQTISKIKGSAAGDSVKSFRGYVWYTSFDYNLAKYFFGFSSQYSVRLDQPDMTNIFGGSGVFGAVSVDSVTLFY